MVSVLICADQQHTRQRLAGVMARAGISRIELSSRAELVARYAHSPLEVVLVVAHDSPGQDAEMITHLLAAHPGAKVIVFGSPRDRGGVAAAVAAGAAGFLRWDGTEPEVAGALTHAMVSPAIMADHNVRRGDRPSLTERELQVLRGMSQGKTNNQIGRELYLSEDTIKTHARRLFHKMGANDRAEAVAKGFRRQILA